MGKKNREKSLVKKRYTMGLKNNREKSLVKRKDIQWDKKKKTIVKYHLKKEKILDVIKNVKNHL